MNLHPVMHLVSILLILESATLGECSARGEVIDGPRSIVFDQAGNRLYAQMALLAEIMGPR